MKSETTNAATIAAMGRMSPMPRRTGLSVVFPAELNKELPQAYYRPRDAARAHRHGGPEEHEVLVERSADPAPHRAVVPEGDVHRAQYLLGLKYVVGPRGLVVGAYPEF